MKKIITFLVFISSLFILVSCNDDPKITVECEATASTLLFNIKCKNEKKVDSGTINLYLYKDYKQTSQKLVQAKGASRYSDTLIFSDLDPNTEYDLRVTCTFKEERGYEVLVKKFSTTEISQTGLTTVEEVKNIKNDLSKATHYTLASDIDFNNEEMTPITNEKFDSFKGTFDGNGYSLKNVKIVTTTQSKVGLFAGIEGTVKNLTIENLTIETTYRLSSEISVGGLAGYLKGTIENVTIKNLFINFVDNWSSSSDSRTQVGGLVGKVESTTKYDEVQSIIRNSKVDGAITVTADNSVAKAGGLVGITTHEKQSTKTIIEKCKVNVVIVATSKYSASIGGLLSKLDNAVEINNTYVKSNLQLNNVSATNSYKLEMGGIAGNSSAANVENVSVDSTIKVTTQSNNAKVYTGAMFGNVNGNITLKNSLANASIEMNLPKKPTDESLNKIEAQTGNAFGNYVAADAGIRPNIIKCYSNTTGVLKYVDEEDKNADYTLTEDVKQVNIESYENVTDIFAALEFDSNIWEIADGKVVLK